jgi:hypothetical protein
MARGAGRASWWAVVCLAALACPAWAATRETREFTILVDNREAGSSMMTIVEDNGDLYVLATGNVSIRGLIPYTWRIEAEEWWKDGRLVRLKSDSTENKTRTVVNVFSDNAGQLQISVNNKTRALSKDIWTNSFWKLADQRFHNKPVPVLEVDTGKEYGGQLQFVGAEQLQVKGQLEKCFHFRVTGPSPADVWFDEYHRLVRQEFTESGHRTIVQLVDKK